MGQKGWKIGFFALLAFVMGYGVSDMSSSQTSAQNLNTITPASGRVASPIETGVLRCGYIPYAPFVEIDFENGGYKGVMVDLIEKIGGKLSLEVEWTEETGWGTMFEGLKQGRYDAICTNVWQVAGRSGQALFSEPVGYSPVHAWKKTGSTLPADLNNDEIAIASIDGEFNAILAQNRFPNARQVSLPQTAPFSDLILQISTGKADLAFFEGSAVKRYLEHNDGDIEQLSSEPVAKLPNVIPMRSDDLLLKQAIDTALAELVQEGDYAEILNKHGLTSDIFMAAKGW